MIGGGSGNGSSGGNMFRNQQNSEPRSPKFGNDAGDDFSFMKNNGGGSGMGGSNSRPNY